MGDPGYFGDASVIQEMSLEHRYLWRSLFQACRPHMTPGMRVLDFGCGDGSMLSFLMLGDGQAWPGWRCALGVGIDRAEMDQVLAAAADRWGGTLPVVFSSSSPEAFPRQFDLVLSHEVIYLLPNLERSFRELHASLRIGGVIALTTGCHRENGLYAAWREELARHEIWGHDYRISDYVQALQDAGFEEIEHRHLTLPVEEYEAWVQARGQKDPNPAWFPCADDERRYYTESGKALFLARRNRLEAPSSGGRRKDAP